MTARYCHTAATPSRLPLGVMAFMCSLVAACAVDDTSTKLDVGSAAVALSGVPNDVRCVRIDVEGASRSTSQKFSVMPGSDAELTLSGLPLGMLTFSGEAFSKACDAVSGNDAGEWSAAGVTVQLVAGETASVQLVMKRNGKAVVEVSFDDDACEDGGMPNTGAPCGSCGGVIECNGTCSVATPSNFGQSCGGCGGSIQCDGSCGMTPSNVGQSCGSCGGTVQCNGTCSVDTPGNLGQPCGGCGGVVVCGGGCSVATPQDLGDACECGGIVTCTGCRPPPPTRCAAGRVCCDTDECGNCTLCAARNSLCP